MTPDGLPLSDLRFSLLGPGRVGSSLAAWCCRLGARLTAVVGRTDSLSAESLAGQLGGSAGPLARVGEQREELLLVAVPDPVLPAVVEGLRGASVPPVVLHTAGNLGASVLDPLRPGSSVGGFHPLKAFARALPDPIEAEGVFFALDGDPSALRMGRRLAEAWGGTAAVVPEDRRTLYHLAARIAAGGVTTLLALAEEIASSAELPPAVVAGYLHLAGGALRAAGDSGHPGAAITGPVSRGEIRTVLRQLDALEAKVPGALRSVLALDRETVRQVERSRSGAGLEALAEALRSRSRRP